MTTRQGGLWPRFQSAVKLPPFTFKHILTPWICFRAQPATVKTHNIIERTANFVCQQGAQFEIVLKAKQAGNSQFDFLRFDHYLNPYYKHILRAMKDGRYCVVSDGQQLQQLHGESRIPLESMQKHHICNTWAMEQNTRVHSLTFRAH